MKNEYPDIPIIEIKVDPSANVSSMTLETPINELFIHGVRIDVKSLGWLADAVREKQEREKVE